MSVPGDAKLGWKHRKIASQLEHLFGGDEVVREAWFARPNAGLRGLVPVELMGSIHGRAILMRYLDQAIFELEI